MGISPTILYGSQYLCRTVTIKHLRFGGCRKLPYTLTQTKFNFLKKFQNLHYNNYVPFKNHSEHSGMA